MSALADALRALLAAASHFGPKHAVHSVLRKHASCEVCNGTGDIHEQHCEDEDCDQDELCFRCIGAGWTPASVEMASARLAEQRRLDAALLCAVETWCLTEGGTHEEATAQNDVIEAFGERQAWRELNRNAKEAT